jgi:hypothetical protein
MLKFISCDLYQRRLHSQIKTEESNIKEELGIHVNSVAYRPVSKR